MLNTNSSSVQAESENRRECIQKIEIALLTWVNKMHAQGVNIPSETVKELGIRILDGVNDMRPAEKNIHWTFCNGAFIDVNANCERSW